MKKLAFSISAVFAAAVAYGQIPPNEPFGDSPGSPTAITYGHPQSTLGLVAQATVEESVLLQPEEAAEAPQAAAETPADNYLGIEFGGGSYKVGNIEGQVYTARIPYSWKIDKRSTLQLQLPISVTRMDDAVFSFSGLSDAQVYGAGLNAGWSYMVKHKDDGGAWRWKVTPSAGFYYRESADLNMGSIVGNIGLSSSLAYQPAEGWVLNLGNSIVGAFSTGVGGRADPVKDSQQVVVNGIQAIRTIGRWSYNAYIMDTRFLSDSIVDGYQTYALGAGYKITRKRTLRLYAIVEDGNNYSAWRIAASTSWRF